MKHFTKNWRMKKLKPNNKNIEPSELKQFWEDFAKRWKETINDEIKNEMELLSLARAVVEEAEKNAAENPATPEILIVVVEPEKKPYKKMITNDLEPMKEIVGGWIEHVTIGERRNGAKLGIILNEEGKLIGLPFNRRIIGYDDLVGNFFITAHNLEGDAITLTEEEANFFIERFTPIDINLR